ncbi:NHL repeat-containing protein [Marilutibacter alkalisoli]|uniref:Phytase n=1 Tax=Marilutibacter alkalisoli TaxID=2591633 RepID=A0A514BPJ1_9GAMM|nr:phytase [Lysobacter alkalisoli]QDH69300.1 phytase [Lysobacter alkalisoli]
MRTPQFTQPRAVNARAVMASFVAALLLASCSSLRPIHHQATTHGDIPLTDAVIPETYITADASDDELDSLATWPTEDGTTWLIATAKASHRLIVFDADTGTRLRTVGGRGEGLGRFNRPNGIAALGEHLFVVERDNRRVQILTLPDFTPLASFGDAVLRSPYGIWVHETAPGEYDAYVTDSFMYGEKYDQVPALEELAERVKHFSLNFDTDHGVPEAHYRGAFGDTSPGTALRIVESIAGDPAYSRLLIADESNPSKGGRDASTLHEYTFDGRYTGRSLPNSTFAAEAEGVALWNCRNDAGYWVAADQLAPLTVFHLFDRHSLEHRGSFRGETTASTDGIALHPAATRAFTGGALYAVHDDKAVAAFDLREVARILGLESHCTD